MGIVGTRTRDERLAGIVKAWDNLSPDVQQSIMLLVDAGSAASAERTRATG